MIPWFASKGHLYLQFSTITPHHVMVRKIERIHTLIHAIYFVTIGSMALYVNFFVTPVFQSAHTSLVVYTLPYLTLAGLILMECVFYFPGRQLPVREVKKSANHVQISTTILNPKEELTMFTFLGVFSTFLVFFYILPLQTLV